ncbi:BTAD domain-containing putative transcriptional regulator [Leifsonia sp. NPDC058292]|uniref:AfsR/SARP family transcriptional regulator n=1 Tax=Leifsonia sp. NPDC058292 TaxID=3346428 RepID=UPI0036DD6DB1
MRRVDSPPRAPRIAVLGPILVEDRSGALSEPAGVLGKSLIVALVLARGSLSVRSLVADLWDDAPPRQERAALQTLVSRVRTASADGLLESTASGYALAIEPQHTDLGLARAHLERAREAEAAGDLRTTCHEVDEALALWRGEPGTELASGPLAEELGRTTAALRKELLLLGARASRLSGDPASAVAALDALAQAEPFDEAVHAERMRSFAAAGRRNDALRAFAELKTALLDNLGSRPGQELVALNAELLQDDDPLIGDDITVDSGPSASAGSESAGSVAPESVPNSAEPAGPATVRFGLRSAPNALIGREYDLDALEDLIATSRLTTILGAGGLGKTRLAQEIGHRAVRTPAVAFVELASVRSADDITLALASTLGIREARARIGDPGAGVDLRSRILGVLAERETLLIVDNCEHIVDAAAAWIADILETTTTVRVLATSRSPLAIGAERVYPLDSLASVDGQHEAAPAVALFMERARAARPGVVLQPDVVARLCERLDGLPLAIELAAARVRSMSVEEIERRLGNRFVLLTGGERTAPERHRTLLAVIDWSWNLLSTTERVLLRRLARFPDGFSAEAAEFVAGEAADTVLDDLEALVNQSLVSVAEDPATGILRYRMLETVREFGDIELVRAGEEQLVQEGMFAWARRFSRSTLSSMHGAQQVRVFNLITAEQDNLVSILRLAIEVRRQAVVAAVFAALAYYWSLRSAHSEVVSFGPVVVAALTGWEPEGAERDDAAGAYAVLGGTLLYLDLRTSARAISRLRRIKRQAPLTDARLNALAELMQLAGRPEEGMAKLAEFARSSDPALAAMGNLMLAQFAENSGEIDQALVTATIASEKAKLADDTWATASAAQALAQLHSQLAHPEEALHWAERSREGLTKLQAAGDLRQLEWIIAINAISAGDLERGRRLLETYLQQEEDPSGFDYEDYYGIGYAGLAEIALAEGDQAEGLRLYEQSISVYGKQAVIVNPWMTILASASLVARLRAHTVDPDLVWEETDAVARKQRIRVLVTYRLRPTYIDKPVVGAGLLGYAVWMLDPHTAAGRGPEWVAAGLELFAMADRTNSRQDMVTLHRAPLEAAVRETWGDADLDAALAASRGLDRNDAVLRGIEVLRGARG